MKRIILPIVLIVLIGFTYYLGVACQRQEPTPMPTPIETPTETETPIVDDIPEPETLPEPNPVEVPDTTEPVTTEPDTTETTAPDGIVLAPSGFLANVPLDDPSIRVYNGVVDPRSVTPYVLEKVTTTSVVNKFNVLPDWYAPDNLVEINANGVGGMYVQQPAAEAWEMWRTDALNQGFTVLAVSSYRSWEYQANLFNNYLTNNGEAALLYSAYPRRSEHEMGLALDLSDSWQIPGEGFIDTPMGQYLADSAYKYGFILRYPKGYEDVTGYSFEPWHFRYVGVEIAAKMRHQNIPTLEHYYELTVDDRN